MATADTALILLITAAFAWRGLRDARRTRHGQLLTDLSRRWDEPQIVRAQLKFAEYSHDELTALAERIYTPGIASTDDEYDDWLSLTQVPNLFETTGPSARQGDHA